MKDRVGMGPAGAGSGGWRQGREEQANAGKRAGGLLWTDLGGGLTACAALPTQGILEELSQGGRNQSQASPTQNTSGSGLQKVT